MITTNYSYDFYLRGIYSSNRGARKSERRSSMQTNELVKADSSAMKKIIEQLRQLEWSEPTTMDDKDANALNTVSDSTNYKFSKLFADTYNNLLDSAGGTTSGQTKRLVTQMKRLTKDQKDALEDIGISITSSGKLSVKKETVNQAATYKFKKILGSDSNYLSDIASVAKKIKRHASQITVPAKKSTAKASSSGAGNTISNNAATNAGTGNMVSGNTATNAGTGNTATNTIDIIL